jgi:hypothetical protein
MNDWLIPTSNLLDSIDRIKQTDRTVNGQHQITDQLTQFANELDIKLNTDSGFSAYIDNRPIFRIAIIADRCANYCQAADPVMSIRYQQICVHALDNFAKSIGVRIDSRLDTTPIPPVSTAICDLVETELNILMAAGSDADSSTGSTVLDHHWYNYLRQQVADQLIETFIDWIHDSWIPRTVKTSGNSSDHPLLDDIKHIDHYMTTLTGHTGYDQLRQAEHFIRSCLVPESSLIEYCINTTDPELVMTFPVFEQIMFKRGLTDPKRSQLRVQFIDRTRSQTVVSGLVFRWYHGDDDYKFMPFVGAVTPGLRREIAAYNQRLTDLHEYAAGFCLMTGARAIKAELREEGKVGAIWDLIPIIDRSYDPTWMDSDGLRGLTLGIDLQPETIAIIECTKAHHAILTSKITEWIEMDDADPDDPTSDPTHLYLTPTASR